MNRKVMLTLGVAAMLGLKLNAQNQEQLAKVHELNGKQIYLLNEPVREFEKVGEIKTGVKITSLLTRGIRNEHANDKTSQFAQKAITKMEKQGIEFDALMYESGKRINAIRFTEESTNENKGIARIKTINGIGVFAMATPVNSYTVTDQVAGGINIVPFLTHGWINPSIEKDLERFAKKADKKQDASYISYQTGRNASVIVMN